MTTNIALLRPHTLMKSVLPGLLVLSVSVALAQSQDSASTNKVRKLHDYAELTKAPERDKAKRNPFEADPDAVAAGRKLFERHCAECHGNTAEGGKKGPSLRAQEVQQATPGTLFWVLTNGVVRRGMPVWSKLPEPQRWQIVLYLRTLKQMESKQ